MGRVDYYHDPAAPAANSLVPSVTAAVRDDRGRLLLIHKVDNDFWALPGGAMDLGGVCHGCCGARGRRGDRRQG